MQRFNENVLEAVSRAAAVVLAVVTTFVVSAATFAMAADCVAGSHAVVTTVLAPVRILLGI